MSSKMRLTEPNNNEMPQITKSPTPASDESDCYSDSNCEEFDFESSDLEELNKETMNKAVVAAANTSQSRLSTCNHLSDSDTEYHEASTVNFDEPTTISPSHSTEQQRSSTPFSDSVGVPKTVGSDLCETVNSSLIVNTCTKSSIGNTSDLLSQESDNELEDQHNKQLHKHSANNSEDYVYADDYDEEDRAFVNLLGRANEIAEARLAARRQARAEAREIRMRELERQQREQEQNADRAFDMHGTVSVDPVRTRLTISSVTNSVRANSMSSRRSSEDSLEEEGRSLRDIRHELKEVDERFRKAMIANAQLDNERASQSYQIQLLKDKLEEMEEAHAQLQREFKEKCRDHDAIKRTNEKYIEELQLVKGQLTERDTLIGEQGLTIVIVENEDGSDARRALVSVENAQLLDTVQGSLDVRLKRFAEDKVQLQNEVHQLQEQLSQVKTQGRRSSALNGPLGDDDYEDAQREANKLIADYKYKLQKAEQEIASLQASLARSETQVIRYKSTAEAAEKAEADLKVERRKLQRENREAMERNEELETANNHLLKRLDKLKNAKSALLKDL